MRRFIFVFLFLPQLVLAQYNAKCFRLDATADTKHVIFRQTITEDAEIPLGVRTRISGLSISGRVVFENDDDSYVRVIMKDEYNYEHLVYENYPLLADGMSVEFQNIAMETRQLDGITPSSVRVELMNATLTLESLNYVCSSANGTRAFENETVLQKVQSRYIVDKLNENLSRHNKTWRAGMTSVAEKTFEEKKGMFGGKLPQFYGFEYYAGGIFVMPGALTSVEHVNTRNITSDPYVSEWDWKNRHGKNWMTPAKDYLSCQTCWAFAAVGAVEAYTNLYYNRNINPDLSEQEIITCTNVGCNRAYESTAFNYIKNNGIVNEICFQYEGDNMNCTNDKCPDPDTLVFINDYQYVSCNTNAIKQALFKNPLTIAIGPWRHSMVIAGYKTIEMGDMIYLGNQSGYNYIIIDANYQSYIGKTAWLLKNCWGPLWGSNGYGYVIVDDSNIMRVQTPTGNVTCDTLDYNGIVCSDADGDGYYLWGLGPKPSHCPSWAPDTPDGDDSDINYGPIDAYGNLQQLPAGVTIKTPTTYASNTTTSNHIGIVNGGKLTITGTTSLTGNGKIRVCEGGILEINGGTLQNADIDLIPGCQVIIKNNGTINMASGKEFYAPAGAVVEIPYGSIN